MNRCFVAAVGLWSAVSAVSTCTAAPTLAYWKFDTFTEGVSPAAVGGEALDLRSAGGGEDFALWQSAELAPIPNPDRTPGFCGDPRDNGGCLRSPGNAVANRYLTTGPGTNVLHLHETAWTFEGWVRCTGDEPDGFGDVIVTTRDEPDYCGLTLKVDPAPRPGEGRRLGCHFEVKALDDGVAASSFWLRTEGLLPVDRWRHVALTWDDQRDGPAVTTLRVDGVTCAQAEAPANFDTAAADRHSLDCLHFGARAGSERNSFAGDFDEFRISEGVLEPVEMLLFSDRPGPPPLASEVAQPRDLPPGTPAASAVVMRALRWRPAGAKDGHVTAKALDDFHATGLVWAYIQDPEVIRSVRAGGRFFQGAVTSSLSTMRSLLGLRQDTDAAETQAFLQRYSCLSLDQLPNEQPWKRYWPNPYSRCSGCCSNAEFEALYVKALQTYLRAGVTSIQRDEPEANAARPNYGACFCNHCMRGFRAFLAERLSVAERTELGLEDVDTFDYRAHLLHAGAPVGDAFAHWKGGKLKQLFLEYQHFATLGFMQRTRKALNQAAGFRVSLSCNNGVRHFDDLMQQFDWFFGELSRRHATPINLYRTAKTAAGLSRLQVVTMPKKGGHDTYESPDGWVRHTRQTIATAYAVGDLCMVPWDVYMPDTFSAEGQRSATPRYFGKPEEYADLYGFIRANAALFDGYEDAGAFGPGLFERRWGLQRPVTVEDGEAVFAFVRAKPAAPRAPVVVHLVDWRAHPEPFTLRLRPEAFTHDQALTLTLLVPAPYNAEQHRAAELEAHRQWRDRGAVGLLGAAEAQAYAALSHSQAIGSRTEDGVLTVAMPALRPWGVLVVTGE